MANRWKTVPGFAVALVVAAMAMGCGAAPSPAAPGAAPARAPALRHGIDVSWHSGTVDWTAVATAGHTFAVIKATEGLDLRDPAFAGHWKASAEAGLVRGAYHFFVTEDDPAAQAALFLSQVALQPGDLAPIVDIEVLGHGSAANVADRLRRWLELVGAHYGVKPIIYTSKRFWDAHVGVPFADYPLWVAEYEVEAPALPLGWNRWHMWQWQGNATIPGVEKGADLSKVNLGADDLHRLLVPPSLSP